MSYELAPIVLFVYNRPWHTVRTLAALSINNLADVSILYIYCDGPKEDASVETLQNIAKVRSIVKEKKWCKEIHIIESEKNNGLAASIRTGVSEIIMRHSKVIVLEDDLLISPAFLTFMNNALLYYENRKTVFSITGYNLPPGKMKIPDDYKFDVFVSLRNGSWGWATWADRWKLIDWEISHFETLSANPYIKEAFNRGGDDVFELLQMQKTGKLNIWSIQFTLAHFVNHAVTISPTISYVDNIGLDGSGENCSPNQNLRNELLNKKSDIQFVDVLYEDSRLINAFYNASTRRKRPFWQKLLNKTSRILGLGNIFYIKKKIYC